MVRAAIRLYGAKRGIVTMAFTLRAGAALAAVILLNIYAGGAGNSRSPAGERLAKGRGDPVKVSFACGMAERRSTLYICPMA